MRRLLDPADADRGLRRMAIQIVEQHQGTEKLLLVGIRRGGGPIAEQLARLLSEQDSTVPVGSVDISLYRDDAGTALPNPRIGPTHIPVSLAGTRVVLCDDVLYTGRTVRAAVDALLDYGRPARVQLAVLVSRKGRELPIQADYLVREVDVKPDERVDVIAENGRFSAVAAPMGSPTTPPPAAGPAPEPTL
jgi:pyrimidine operon attenuation protein / uracil phosphoribosyltransferase